MSSEEDKFDQKKIDRLNDFAKDFRALKDKLLSMELDSVENVRIAIEHLDDGYLRAREAIFAIPMLPHTTEPETKEPDDTESLPLAAVH